LGLRDAEDLIIFNQAKAKKDIVIITKDEDFCELLNRLQAPPKIIWLTFGNCSNDKMKEILKRDLPESLSILKDNDMVEISA
jgi:predicted nuclease of predicted toxin-antitoxin system